MAAPGALIADRYRLVRQLGAGGMGVVWEARDERLGRLVAVKQLRTQPGATEAETDVITQRAMREARINARLQHPYAVSVFDVVDHEDRPCIVMELVPSEPLTAVLRELGSLDPAEAARVGAQVASALATAHELGIVHRDVKPGNILVGEDGTARICDFGISRSFGDTTLTMTGMITGTPAYLAPEAARGEESTFASDVFSLGATLYAAVEGVPPFGNEGNAMAVLYRVVAGELRPPERAGELGLLLVAMMSPRPQDRPTMAQAAAQLARMADGGVDVPPPVTPGRTRPLPVQPTAPMPAAVADSPGPTRPTGPTVPTGPTGVSPGSPEPSPQSPSTPLLPHPAVRPAQAPSSGPADDPSPGTEVGAQPGREAVDAQRDAHSEAQPPAALPVPPMPSGPPPRRRRSLVVVAILLAVAVVAAAAFAISSLGTRATDGTGAGATGSAAGSPSASSSVSPTGSAPTAAELAAAVTAYYGLLPDDTDAGWKLLTPSYQQQTGGRNGYEGFWNSIASVTVSDVSATLPNRVQATITYVAKNGNQKSTERRSFQLVESDGVLKIDKSAVI